MLGALVISGCTSIEKNDKVKNSYETKGANESPKIYQIESRLEEYIGPTTFTPTKAVSVNGAITENYATWEFYSDDSREYEGMDKAPTSRDYFTLGTSFCLMSQLTANKTKYSVYKDNTLNL